MPTIPTVFLESGKGSDEIPAVGSAFSNRVTFSRNAARMQIGQARTFVHALAWAGGTSANKRGRENEGGEELHRVLVKTRVSEKRGGRGARMS